MNKKDLSSRLVGCHLGIFFLLFVVILFVQLCCLYAFLIQFDQASCAMTLSILREKNDNNIGDLLNKLLKP